MTDPGLDRPRPQHGRRPRIGTLEPGHGAASSPAARGAAPYNPCMRSRSLKRAAGVVVVRDTADGPRFLLLRAYRNWDLPKGRLEAGETSLEGAIREVREETGLGDLDFAWG
jgi:hypothetical protein